MNELETLSHSPEDTWRIAGQLVDTLPARATLALEGELGSGKTCFVQGIAMALGILEAVTSPTFTLVNEYKGRRPLVHIDLYRLRRPQDLFWIDFESYLEADGITAVEWAERAGDLMPADAIHVFFKVMPDPRQRAIRIVRPTTTFSRISP